MIKFNEVTWYSKLAAIVFFIGALPALTFYIGTEYEKTKEVTMPLTVTTPATSHVTTNGHYELSTYTNKMYGWSFKYPSTWKVTEDKDGTGVSIDPGVRVAGYLPDQKAMVEKYSLGFSTIKKKDFGTINSKVGMISFDSAKDALVDGLDTPSRCLPVSEHIGLHNALSGFMYTGSLMSDPAYGGSAIVTNKDYLITYGWQSYENDDAFALGQSIIYGTFTLAPDVYSIVPRCVAQ